jgi:transcriptional regulator with XRE-family HTH domain
LADNMKTQGERIRELREELDLSLRELARSLDVSAAFMSDVELGRRYPTEDMLAKIAKKLRTSFEDLKSYDSRAPVDELRRMASSDPAFGFALRRVVDGIADDQLTPQELLKMLDAHRKRRSKE